MNIIHIEHHHKYQPKRFAVSACTTAQVIASQKSAQQVCEYPRCNCGRVQYCVYDRGERCVIGLPDGDEAL